MTLQKTFRAFVCQPVLRYALFAALLSTLSFPAGAQQNRNPTRQYGVTASSDMQEKNATFERSKAAGRVRIKQGTVVEREPASVRRQRGSVNKALIERPRLLKQFVDELVLITPGKGKFPKSFQMGSSKGGPSEQPVREVTLTQDFWISKYEVPQDLYEAVMGRNPSRWKGPRNAAEMFNWNQANDFCRLLTSLLRKEKLIGKDELIRLPTEAEWEYCCRAGTSTEFSFGDNPRKPDDAGNQAAVLDEYAWHTGNAAGNDPPVGALKPNPWGLYDMHGYLWEFVADPWHDNYKNAPSNGAVWDSDTNDPPRVARGGAWTDRFDHLRSAFRAKITSTTVSPALGLRCIKAKVKKSEN